MKKILTLLSVMILSISCFASADTLPEESSIRLAEQKVDEAEKRLEAAQTSAKEAKKKDMKIKKEFNKATEAFENAETPEARAQALPIFSRLTEEHGKAIDNALLTADEVRKAKLALDEAQAELEKMQEQKDWVKTRIRHR